MARAASLGSPMLRQVSAGVVARTAASPWRRASAGTVVSQAALRAASPPLMEAVKTDLPANRPLEGARSSIVVATLTEPAPRGASPRASTSPFLGQPAPKARSVQLSQLQQAQAREEIYTLSSARYPSALLT